VPGFVCVARFAPPGGSRVDSAPATADQTGTVVLTVGVPATALSGSGSVIATCNDPTNAGNSASSPAQSVTVTGLQTSPSPSASPSPASSAGPSPGPPVPSPGAFAVSATLVGTPQPLAPGSLVTIAIVTMPGAGCSISSVVSSAGTSLAIAGSGASGVATLTGALTLTFDLPVTVIPGTEAALVTCSFNGTQGSARVTFQFDRSPGVANCDGGSAAAGLPSAAGSPVANPGSGYRGSAGEPVQFSGERSRPSSGAVLTSCLWNFGDGQTAATLNPSHTYAVEGAYSASLTITDSAGLSATAATPVNVSAYLPLCSQPALTGSAGLTACVTGLNCPATSLAGRCLPPCLTLPSTSLPVANGCPQPTRTVEIRINGPFLGQPSQPISLQATVRLTGTRRLCAADATLGVAGPICTIQPDNNLPAPVAYLWDFGDGQAGEGSQVSHAYSNPGEYPIELTLTFADDSTAKATSIARITAPTRKVSLTGGCTLLSLTFADGTRPATVAGAVSGGALSAIWLFSAAPPFKGWYPDTAAPQELSTLNRGDVVWLCTGGTATLTEPV
ncbi:MAG: PKD domain-containing protein, partial [Dehalococcoidia bacterium]